MWLRNGGTSVIARQCAVSLNAVSMDTEQYDINRQSLAQKSESISVDFTLLLMTLASLMTWIGNRVGKILAALSTVKVKYSSSVQTQRT
jgi:hypothetical protein